MYFAYPGDAVNTVAMNLSAIPPGTKLFQPMYWPQYLVIEEGFSKELERQCSGGYPGYYFWTLPMTDVADNLHKTMVSLR